MTGIFAERYELVLVIPALDDAVKCAETNEMIDIEDSRLNSEIVQDNPEADAYALYVTLEHIDE